MHPCILKSSHFILLITIIALFLLSCDYKLNFTSPYDNGLPSPVFGSITGIVKNKDTSEPLSGVAISCMGSTVYSSPSGNYKLGSLPAGKYLTATAKKTGYEEKRFSVKVEKNQTHSYSIFMIPLQ